ncbi:MAG: alpha/beta hydrolase [Clostridia bacterium]|nr:alpha/beta hydrolase [Clostridia bacterium]
MEKRKTDRTRGGKIKRILLIAAAALALHILLSFAAVAIVFSAVFGRSDETLPFLYTYSELAGDSQISREIGFDSDGNRLFGRIYDCSDPKGLIVVVNGIGANADYHLPKILRFLDDGWTVATYDATGVRRSGGDGKKGLPQIRRDLAAFLTFLESTGEFDGMTTVLFGHSAGGYAATSILYYDSQINPFGIDAVVSVSGFDSPDDVMLSMSTERVGPVAYIHFPFICAYNALLFGADADLSAFDAINRTDVPVLLYQGMEDRTVAAAAGLTRFDGSFLNPNVTCVEIPSGERASHSTVWLTEEAARYVNSYVTGTVPDKAEANELDPDFMNEVIGFFNAAENTH